MIVSWTKDLRDRYTAGPTSFYTSGQVLLEGSCTLGIIGRAGLGTPHMGSQTRLRTATSAAALRRGLCSWALEAQRKACARGLFGRGGGLLRPAEPEARLKRGAERLPLARHRRVERAPPIGMRTVRLGMVL